MVQKSEIGRIYEASERMKAQIGNAFTYHAPEGDQASRYEYLRKFAAEFAVAIARHTPESREQSLALTNLEQAVMWANKAIACNESP